MIWFGLVLWHIILCRLFYIKSYFYMYIKYIWFGLVWFYGISSFVGYFISNPISTCILSIYDLVWFWFYGISSFVGYFISKSYFYMYIKYIWFWFGLVLWHINLCRLFYIKSYFYMYIKYIWLGLVWFYGISTFVGYFISNPISTCILSIYDLVWFGFMAYQPL